MTRQKRKGIPVLEGKVLKRSEEDKHPRFLFFGGTKGKQKELVLGRRIHDLKVQEAGWE